MKSFKLPLIFGSIGAVVTIPLLFFFMRPPVLVVTNAPFAALYGASHLKQQQISASLSLLRRVRPVIIADGASPDIVAFAITEVSRQPLCVLFARSQVTSALYYHEQFPGTPVVVLKGLVQVPELPSPDDFLYVYGTDREVDLYRAGLFSGILGTMRQKPMQQTGEKEETAVNSFPVQRTYALWQDRLLQTAEREFFSLGIREYDPESVIVFARTVAEMPDEKRVSCAVLTGTGGEYLEKNPKIPLMLFSWIDPALTAREVVIQFDDSPWALAVPAARMAVQGQIEGKIPSKPLIFSGKIADNNIFRMLEKSAKKMP